MTWAYKLQQETLVHHSQNKVSGEFRLHFSQNLKKALQINYIK